MQHQCGCQWRFVLLLGDRGVCQGWSMCVRVWGSVCMCVMRLCVCVRMFACLRWWGVKSCQQLTFCSCRSAICHLCKLSAHLITQLNWVHTWVYTWTDPWMYTWAHSLVHTPPCTVECSEEYSSPLCSSGLRQPLSALTPAGHYGNNGAVITC